MMQIPFNSAQIIVLVVQSVLLLNVMRYVLCLLKCSHSTLIQSYYYVYAERFRALIFCSLLKNMLVHRVIKSLSQCAAILSWVLTLALMPVHLKPLHIIAIATTPPCMSICRPMHVHRYNPPLLYNYIQSNQLTPGF